MWCHRTAPIDSFGSISLDATFRYIGSIRHSTAGSGRPALELAILGLLVASDLHGYELRRRLSQTLGPIGRLSFGTLYPALNRLETAGAVAVVKVTESRTGLTTARGRKVYTVTEQGKALFEELLDQPATPDDDKAFALRLAFARHLSREARMRLLLRRREQLATRLDEMEQNLADSNDDVDEYRRMLMEHTSEMTSRDISWIDSLIVNENKITGARASDEQQATP